MTCDELSRKLRLAAKLEGCTVTVSGAHTQEALADILDMEHRLQAAIASALIAKQRYEQMQATVAKTWIACVALGTAIAAGGEIARWWMP